MDKTEFLQSLAAVIMTAVLGSIGIAVGFGYKRFQKYIEKREAELERSAMDKAATAAMKYAADMIYGIVGKVQQKTMMDAHAKLADGKMSKEEFNEIAQRAGYNAMEEAKILTLGRLQAAAGMTTETALAYIKNTMETAVLMTKAAAAPLMPAPPQSSLASGMDATSTQSEPKL